MRSRTVSGSFCTSMPSTQASPSVIGNMPVSILITVVFPLPFGPRNPKTSPFSTVIDALFTAVKLPKRRVRFLVCMACITVSPRQTVLLRLRRRQADCHGFHAQLHSDYLVDPL